jgi:hypothetical protein
MMEEEEYQQEVEGGEMGMEDGAQSSGTPIAALEVCARPADRCASACHIVTHSVRATTGPERHLLGRREEAH